MRTRALLVLALLIASCGGAVQTTSTDAPELCAQHGTQPFRLFDAAGRSLSASALGVVWVESGRVRLLRRPGDQPQTLAQAEGVRSALADDACVWWLRDTGSGRELHQTTVDGADRAVASLAGSNANRMAQSASLVALLEPVESISTSSVRFVDKLTGAVMELSTAWQRIERRPG